MKILFQAIFIFTLVIMLAIACLLMLWAVFFFWNVL